MGSSKRLSGRQAAARLSIAVKDLPRSGAWTRQQVGTLRAERPDWLTRARRDYAAGQDAKATQRTAQDEADPADFTCLCCKAEFPFTIDSGGLCEVCNEGECPDCGGDDQDWMDG